MHGLLRRESRRLIKEKNMTTELIKSSPQSRREAIIHALELAHEEALRHCKCSLNRMPEYFMAVKVAEYIATRFKNFGYRLEASVRDTLQDIDFPGEQIEELMNSPELRGNGRFDLVLRTGKAGLPAHILEFKRGSRSLHLATDISRLAFVCDRVKSGARLETNYLVATTRKTKEELESQLREVDQQVAKARWLNEIDFSLAAYKVLGKFTNKQFEVTDRDFAVAVFEVRYK